MHVPARGVVLDQQGVLQHTSAQLQGQDKSTQ